MFEKPNASEVEPTTINDAESIQAYGDYRDHIDEALTVGERVHGCAAHAIRDRAKTTYDVQSVEEAEALIDAAKYVLESGVLRTAPQEAAVRRVGQRAATLSVAITTEAHGIDTADDDDDQRVMTDGGRPAHPPTQSTPNRTGASGGDHAGTADAGEPETVPKRSVERVSTDVSGAIRPAIIASRQGSAVKHVTFENGKVRIWYRHTPPLAVDRLARDHGFILGASSRRGPYLYRSVADVNDDGTVN